MKGNKATQFSDIQCDSAVVDGNLSTSTINASGLITANKGISGGGGAESSLIQFYSGNFSSSVYAPTLAGNNVDLYYKDVNNSNNDTTARIYMSSSRFRFNAKNKGIPLCPYIDSYNESGSTVLPIGFIDAAIGLKMSAYEDGVYFVSRNLSRACYISLVNTAGTIVKSSGIFQFVIISVAQGSGSTSIYLYLFNSSGLTVENWSNSYGGYYLVATTNNAAGATPSTLRTTTFAMTKKGIS
ncbi:MAG: hypothetical protein NC218_02565 [Acetobacter sp.]|nr:hypothetical protein [Acetobacter sp.]